MLSYLKTVTFTLLKCRKNKRIMILCVVCGTKKLKFIKVQEASGVLSGSGMKRHLSQFPLLGLRYKRNKSKVQNEWNNR